MKFKIPTDKAYWINEAKEWGQSLIWAILVTLVVRTYVVQAFKIPSGSMIPTLHIGDKLFVNKYVYRFEAPKRGDIIVFRYPLDKRKDFIKRLVGLPGDHIEIRDGKIRVDDRELNDPETFGKFYYYNHDPFGGPNEVVTVPADSYFMLGDNSANSTDGRFWGFVPKKNLVGKAVFRWWPPNRMGKVK